MIIFKEILSICVGNAKNLSDTLFCNNKKNIILPLPIINGLRSDQTFKIKTTRLSGINKLNQK